MRNLGGRIGKLATRIRPVEGEEDRELHRMLGLMTDGELEALRSALLEGAGEVTGEAAGLWESAVARIESGGSRACLTSRGASASCRGDFGRQPRSGGESLACNT